MLESVKTLRLGLTKTKEFRLFFYAISFLEFMGLIP